MSLRTVLVILLALICGGSAAAGVSVVLRRKSAEAAKVKTTPVVVAAVDIARGMPLKPELLATRAWPEDMVPAGTLSDVEEAVDRAVMTSMVAGEPVLASKLAEPGLLGAAALIDEGMRAFTISTPSPSSGVAGFLLPRNHVDILLTFSGGSSSGGHTTSTLLQNVEILAAGTRLNTTKDSQGKVQQSRSVTLLVTPDQAAKLTLAQSVGTLNLTLRNDHDDLFAETNVISINELRFLQEYGAAAEPDDSEAAESPEPPVDTIKPTPSEPPMIFALRGKSASVLRFAPRGSAPQ